MEIRTSVRLGQVAQLETAESAAITKERELVGESTGIAARLQALWELSQTNWEVLLTHIAIAVTLAALETAAVLGKTASLLGEPSTYERVAKLHSDAVVAVVEDDLVAERQLARRLRQVEDDQRVKSHEKEVAAVMAAWEEKVSRQAKSDPDQFLVL